jgi:hypothetical protein
MASGSSTKVELLTGDLKCEGSNPATADNGGLHYKNITDSQCTDLVVS